MKYRTVLLTGAPGSGKGTQGKILGTVPGFFHCACGDVFRSLDLNSDIGRAFWGYSSRGELVPDGFTVELWQQAVRGMEATNRFHPETETLVLDGIPRNLGQARLLADALSVVGVIHLDCSDQDKLAERLRRRALKENRLDDASNEVILRRMDVYENETRPLLKFYPPEMVHRVNAAQAQVQVLIEILGHLVETRGTLEDTSVSQLLV